MKITFQLDCREPQQKYLKVQMNLELTAHEAKALGGKLVLNFPAWTPGSYLLREHERLITDFEVQSASKKSLNWEKINKCQWQIETKSALRVQVNYRIYANLLNVRGVYADHEKVFVNSCGAFFHPDGFLNNKIDLKIQTPRGWQLHLASRAVKGVYKFKHFDELYDTPIFAAKEARVDRFKVKNTSIRIVTWGYSACDLSHVVPEMKKIIAKQIQIFGDHPCKEYLFQVIMGSGLYGGLEHSHCSTNMFDGSKLHDENKFKDYISLLAHEHFHLWNVKRIRPVALGPFDYLNEAYTRELWIAEGVTRFYDDHSLVRTKLFTPQEYLNHMAKMMTMVDNQKAYYVNSLSDSSFDAWIRFYRRNENHENTVANYYTKGGLVMMILDLQILKVSNGKASLDTVMRDLYKLYKKRPETGITREEFFEVVQKYTGRDGKRFISKYIDGTGRMSWKESFNPLGVEVKYVPLTKDPYHLGASFKEQNGRFLIASIKEDSPAYKSALQAKDEVVAVNGRRVDSLDGLSHLLDESEVAVLCSRDGQVFETKVKLAPNKQTKIELKIGKKLTSSQKTMLSAFLRTPYE